MVFGTEFGLESDSLSLPSNEDGDGIHLCTFSSDLGAPCSGNPSDRDKIMTIVFSTRLM